MVREIVFDTETTGFEPKEGHRIVEIGAVELINHIPTGKTFHKYINPDRDMPEQAFKVHGLSEEFLKNHPRFSEIIDDFLEFIGDDSMLVAHNASFDMNFINYEMEAIGREVLSMERVVDTLEIAKNMFPGARNNLDALCRRFNVDNSNRTNHGALLDSELLAQVYLELIGGQEPTMEFAGASGNSSYINNFVLHDVERAYREPRVFEVAAEELAAHDEFLEKKIKKAVWLEEKAPE